MSCSCGPAHATGDVEPESAGVASELEQQEQQSRLELQSLADQAALAAKALAALESDIAALRADQQELDAEDCRGRPAAREPRSEITTANAR